MLVLRYICSLVVSLIRSNISIQIKRLVLIMKYYHHAWPIDTFLKQYLGSSAMRYQNDLKKLTALDEIPSRQKPVVATEANKESEDFINFSSRSESDSELEMDDEDNRTCFTKVRHFRLISMEFSPN